MGMRKKRSPFGEKAIGFLDHWGCRNEFERYMKEEPDPIAGSLDEYINLFEKRDSGFRPVDFISAGFVWPDDYWSRLDLKWRKILDEEGE
jgi:hypothetical protein